MEAVENLMTLARSRDPADRERLLDAVVGVCELCDEGGRSLSPAIRKTLEPIFMSIVSEAERDIRLRLSQKIAHAAWAPEALVNCLAFDDLEIASPVIAASPLLHDRDLIEILLRATLEHQLAVARRPGLATPVVEAIIEQGDPAVLTALAGNDTAEINPAAMQQMVHMARDVVALRSPLARHPGLSGELAVELYEWVGKSLRTALADRFEIDEPALVEAIRQSSREAIESPLVWTKDGWAARRTVDAERNLVAKLYAAGQLRSSYLIKALRETRLTLFVEGISVLGGFQPDQIRRAIDSDRPELLALACVAVGIDRGAFPSILAMVRAQNEQRPGGGEEGLRLAAGAFGPFDVVTAGTAFTRALAATVQQQTALAS